MGSCQSYDGPDGKNVGAPVAKDSFKGNISTLRKDLDKNGQNFFATFFVQFPKFAQAFPEFVDKTGDELREINSFRHHARAVYGNALDIFEQSDDPAKLKKNAKGIVDMRAHKGVSLSDQQDFMTVFKESAKKELGDDFDSTGWDTNEQRFMAALDEAGIVKE